ncbi:MAG: hypothetical protein KY445_14675 [Armatimonadetes bacterium]|nr:hypothetical protein [Armatimonadota bacterium]
MIRISHLALAGALFLALAPVEAQIAAPGASLGAPQRTLGPSGVRREAGSWLFNDSIFVAEGPNAALPNAPLFLADLRRDRKTRLPFFRVTPTRGALSFATLPLPTLREITAPDFNFAALQARLTAQIGQASRSGSFYAGWSLPTTVEARASLSKEAVAPVIKRLRAVLDAVAPTSALILEVHTGSDPLGAAADIDAAAPSTDAVVLRAGALDAGDLWPLKMARRVAEEQNDYDLPIFVAPPTPDASPQARAAWETRLAEFWMGGATGFLLPDALVPSWEASVRRNAGLFAGAVTLEDAAVLPSRNPKTLQIAAILREVGRIPLVGRLADGKENRGESLLAVLDDATTLQKLEEIEKAARAGASIYLEGVPNLQNVALVNKLAAMTSTSIEVLPTPKNDILTLDDLWLFGTARGREFPVVQRVKWTPKASLAAQTRVKKGEASPFPSSAAKLTSDSNGLLLAPLGRGQILWLAHTPLAPNADDAARRAFYAAIAGNLQASLASWKWATVEDETRGAGSLRVALRASSTGTPIVAVFNEGDSNASIALSARSDAPVALDLGNEREIAATVVGYTSTIDVQIPARGWRWFAFGKTRAALDKDRLMPRPKARNR